MRHENQKETRAERPSRRRRHGGGSRRCDRPTAAGLDGTQARTRHFGRRGTPARLPRTRVRRRGDVLPVRRGGCVGPGGNQWCQTVRPGPEGSSACATRRRPSAARSRSGTSASNCAPARCWRCSARTARARAPASSCWPASIRPTRGSVVIDGEPVAFASPLDAQARRHRGHAPASRACSRTCSVAENIFMGHMPRGASAARQRRACAREAEAVLASIGLPIDVGAKLGGLRTSEQQLVEIARALSLEGARADHGRADGGAVAARGRAAVRRRRRLCAGRAWR